MLLVPADRKSISTKAKPAAIAYVHGDSWSSVECRDQFAELFRLLPREAEIALALCRGKTIAEVALDLGLTLGTTRNYSKTISAKTDARGLPDLVRPVVRSVLAIAPSTALQDAASVADSLITTEAALAGLGDDSAVANPLLFSH